MFLTCILCILLGALLAVGVYYASKDVLKNKRIKALSSDDEPNIQDVFAELSEDNGYDHYIICWTFGKYGKAGIAVCSNDRMLYNNLLPDILDGMYERAKKAGMAEGQTKQAWLIEYITKYTAYLDKESTDDVRNT